MSDIREEEQKLHERIMRDFRRLRKIGSDTFRFSWQNTISEYEYQKTNVKKEEIEEIEAKHSETKENKTETLSFQLTDETQTQMCENGHSNWENDSEDIKDNKCIGHKCQSMKDRKFCVDCSLYESGNKTPYIQSILVRHIYCMECRQSNAEMIRNAIKMDRLKAEIIRAELVQKPYLEMDLMCDMPRKASLDTLLNDIYKLQSLERGKWCLIEMDLDHLKAWNDCLGHPCADKLITKIGNIMNKYVTEVNNGQWINEKDEYSSFTQAFVYRTGGDEFLIALKSGRYGSFSNKLGLFYTKMKAEINGLGSNISQFVDTDLEWKETKKRLETAKDRKGNDLNMSNVGISTAIFVPSFDEIKDKDWLFKADKVALEHAKTLNLPNKNRTAIYYEEIGGLIADNKVEKCLEIGVWEGRK